MADFGGAMQGGVNGAASGAGFGPMGAAAMGVAGLLGGLFGGHSGPSHAQKNYQELLNQNINQVEGYANGIPLSDPQERAALAEQHGLLGARQRGTANSLMASWNPTADGRNSMDFMANLRNNQVGQQGALDAAALMNSLNQRKQALSQVTPMIQTGFGMASQPDKANPNSDLPALFGNLMQTIAYNKSRSQKNPATDNPLAGMFGGGGNGSTPGAGPSLTMPGGMGGVGMAGNPGGAIGTGHYGFGPAVKSYFGG